jgi:hypothetical protein
MANIHLARSQFHTSQLTTEAHRSFRDGSYASVRLHLPAPACFLPRHAATPGPGPPPKDSHPSSRRPSRSVRPSPAQIPTIYTRRAPAKARTRPRHELHIARAAHCRTPQREEQDAPCPCVSVAPTRPTRKCPHVRFPLGRSSSPPRRAPGSGRRGPSRARNGAGPVRRPRGDAQDVGQGRGILLRGPAHAAQGHPRRGPRGGAQVRGPAYPGNGTRRLGRPHRHLQEGPPPAPGSRPPTPPSLKP